MPGHTFNGHGHSELLNKYGYYTVSADLYRHVSERFEVTIVPFQKRSVAYKMHIRNPETGATIEIYTSVTLDRMLLSFSAVTV